MSDDKYKNIPTLEVPVLEDVVTPGNIAAKDSTQTTDNTQNEKPVSKSERNSGDRRNDDRRKKNITIPEGEAERRVAQRRNSTRRSDDKYVKETLDQLAEKIMQDMMPDLEQHLFMQLRFELQKYVPQILREYKDKEEE